MSRNNYEHDALIGEFQHEAHRHRSDEALLRLRKIASLVKPIMRQRGWRVAALAEFFPHERNLLGLNINKGEKICLRLRYPGDERQFMPIEEVTDTMLHELCHIVHGPHDENFHALWATLRNEHEALVHAGYTGEGFLSTGHKLGGRRIPMDEARRLARAAAEKRRIRTASSGQKLGGRSVRRGEDIRRVIADAAARRMRVEQGCGASRGTSKERQREIMDATNRNTTKTKAEPIDLDEETMMIAYIDLVQEEEREKYGEDYIPPSKENPAGSQGRRLSKAGLFEEQRRLETEASQGRNSAAESSNRRPAVLNSTKPPPSKASTRPSPPTISKPPQQKQRPPPPLTLDWTCPICTLLNPPTYLCCDACSTERPSPPPSPTISSSTPRTDSHTSSLFDSNKTKAVRSLINLDKTSTKKVESEPVGWTCWQCGNFMENEWWTCARCHAMKLTS